MINRYTTFCTVCNNKHTLRITVGTEPFQEHNFECDNCKEEIRVGLEVFLKEKIQYSNFPGVSSPRTELKFIQNCEACEEEGIIINLDSNFLVTKELLNKDGVFPWMYEIKNLDIVEEESSEPVGLPKVSDIFDQLGGVRNLCLKISIVIKAWRLSKIGKSDLSENILIEFWSEYSDSPLNMNECVILLIRLLVGKGRHSDMMEIINFMVDVRTSNSQEYYRSRNELLSTYDDSIDKHFEHLREFVKGFSQFNQVLVYVKGKKKLNEESRVSSKDFRLVKMFYGNLFEDVTANYFVPACLNNIHSGRAFDQFMEMDLKKYLTLNKANRHKPFEANESLSILHKNIDSTLRNASHHGAIRLSSNSNVIEYRSGDSGEWKKISYSEYIYKCTDIMMTSMYILMIQTLIIGDYNKNEN